MRASDTKVPLTTLLVVEDVERARSFYTDVLGAELFREYGGTSAVLRFQGAWILLVTGGRAHSRQPTVTFAPPSDPHRVSHHGRWRRLGCEGG